MFDILSKEERDERFRKRHGIKTETEKLVSSLKWKAKTIASRNEPYGYKLENMIEYKAAILIEQQAQEIKLLKNKTK